MVTLPLRAARLLSPDPCLGGHEAKLLKQNCSLASATGWLKNKSVFPQLNNIA